MRLLIETIEILLSVPVIFLLLIDRKSRIFVKGGLLIVLVNIIDEVGTCVTLLCLIVYALDDLSDSLIDYIIAFNLCITLLPLEE